METPTSPLGSDSQDEFTIDIEIYSDTVCPYCYLGKKALDKAIATYTEQHPEASFNLKWKPYMLSPNAGVSAYTKTAAINSLFGPSASAIFARLAQLGAAYDVTFAWNGISGNSRDSHRLVLLAQSQDADSAITTSPAPDPPTQSQAHPSTTPHQQIKTSHFLTTLFQSIFTIPPNSPPDITPSDPSSRAFLAPLAVQTGLFPSLASAHAFLESDAFVEDVNTSSAEARQVVGVTAVPTYVVQGRWQVGGMQSEEVWLEVFERVRGGKGGEGGV